MYYFKENNNVIEKYKVIVDKERLINIRDEIVKNSTKYKHITEYLNKNDIKILETIKNYQISYIDNDIYRIDYDIRNDIPSVIKYIDRLLNDDYLVVDYLLGLYPKYKNKNNININNIEELENLLIYLKTNELNKTIKDVKYYYEDIKSTITLEKIDEIDKNNIKDNIVFFNQDKILEKKLIK